MAKLPLGQAAFLEARGQLEIGDLQVGMVLSCSEKERSRRPPPRRAHGHAPARHEAGLAIVALRYLGRDGASPDMLVRLASKLDDADRQRLRRVRLGSTVDQLAAA